MTFIIKLILFNIKQFKVEPSGVDVNSKYSGSEEQRVALDTFIKLMRSVNVLTREFREGKTSTVKITYSQFGVLEALLHLGTLSQKQLCQKILRTKGNLSLVVENLKKAGLVERHRDPDDRRKFLVGLTEKGRNVIGDIFPPHAQTITKLMSILSLEEQQTLGQLCRKLGLGIQDSSRRN